MIDEMIEDEVAVDEDTDDNDNEITKSKASVMLSMLKIVETTAR